MPVERLRWNECVPPDIGPGHPSDKFFEPIGWNPITRALGGQHLGGHHRACPDVLRGNHAFTEARAHWDLRWNDPFLSRAQRHFNVANIAHELLKSDRLQRRRVIRTGQRTVLGEVSLDDARSQSRGSLAHGDPPLVS